MLRTQGGQNGFGIVQGKPKIELYTWTICEQPELSKSLPDEHFNSTDHNGPDLLCLAQEPRDSRSVNRVEDQLVRSQSLLNNYGRVRTDLKLIVSLCAITDVEKRPLEQEFYVYSVPCQWQKHLQVSSRSRGSSCLNTRTEELPQKLLLPVLLLSLFRDFRVVRDS